MASFQPYSFSDKSYKKPLLPKKLREGVNLLYEWKVVKLLLGLMDIQSNIDARIIIQNTNYSSIPYSENHLITRNVITNASPSFNISQIKLYLEHNNRYQNQNFHEDLLNEFAAYFHKKTSSPLTSFLHIYRILERISYIFPLIYVSNSHNYVGTFNKVKNYFTKPDSELGFFRIFLKDFMENDVVFQSGTADFVFSHTNLSVNEVQFKLLKRYFGNKISSEVPNSSISIKYADLLDLIVELRNRYFHFKSAEVPNINQKEIIDEDVFFAIMNDTFLNWIAYIFFKIIEHNISRM